MWAHRPRSQMYPYCLPLRRRQGGALKTADPGRVITAAEYNALIDAIIEALYMSAQTTTTIQERDNS